MKSSPRLNCSAINLYRLICSSSRYSSRWKRRATVMIGITQFYVQLQLKWWSKTFRQLRNCFAKKKASIDFAVHGALKLFMLRHRQLQMCNGWVNWTDCCELFTENSKKKRRKFISGGKAMTSAVHTRFKRNLWQMQAAITMQIDFHYRPKWNSRRVSRAPTFPTQTRDELKTKI